MADADEALIPTAPLPSSTSTNNPSAPPDPDADYDSDTPDYSLLSTLLASSRAKSTTTSTDASSSLPSALPRRGEKDFEPHGTTAQADVLARSRAEMHAVLAVTRVHQAGRRITAVYERATGRTRVEVVRSRMFVSMGWTDSNGATWLRAEEALYLVERGDLEVRWEVERQGDAEELGTSVGEDEAASPGFVTFSLQTAYAVYVGDATHGVSLERYNVYANLKRAGYAVFRSAAWDPEEFERQRIKNLEDQDPTSSMTRSGSDSKPNSAWNWLYSLLSRTPTSQPGSLINVRGPWRSYAAIYSHLSLIPTPDPTATADRDPNPPLDDASNNDEDPIHISFEVYKPQGSFKKSNPGAPDFRIAVLSARDTDMLSIAQINGLLATTKYDPPAAPPVDADNAGRMYARLRHGYRNVILAVVDEGIISYLRLADAGFGREKLWAGAGRGRGNKGGRGRGRGGRGGGWGGRGRGRGG